jgi:hypothetical protein
LLSIPTENAHIENYKWNSVSHILSEEVARTKLYLMMTKNSYYSELGVKIGA